MEHSRQRGADGRIPVGVFGMGGMHARCPHRKIAGARVAAVSVVCPDRALAQKVDVAWLDRFEPAYTIELQEWAESIGSGRPARPAACGGYASLVVAEACIASVRPGKPEGVSLPEKPVFYEQESPGAAR